MKIDAHQHFWQPKRGDYHWMPKDNAILNRAYEPQDLIPVLNKYGIDGTVLVQAAASVEETEYMLGLADSFSQIKGVVGWINFEDEAHLDQLTRLSAHPKFLGVRPMIQDIPNVDWMLHEDVQWAYRALIDLDLSFDALGFPKHISNFLKISQRYPKLRIVFDHSLKPQIRDQQAGCDAFSEWAKGISQLSELTNGYCKLSGLITEATDGWSADDIQPFAQHVIEAFGPKRVMWGSDWPVCRLQVEYDEWYKLSQSLTKGLSAIERDQIFGLNATQFYRLGQEERKL